MAKKEPRRRIRSRGFSVGQVREDIALLYENNHLGNNLNLLVQEVIEERLLGHPITCKEDLAEAEKYLNNVGYSNIGEFLENYMRREVQCNFEVCMNCDHYSRNKCNMSGLERHPYYKGENCFVAANTPKKFDVPYPERKGSKRK